MVTLQAFVDDSIASTGDQRLFLGVYVNSADRWTAFSEAWEATRRTAPAIDYLKMSEAEARRGQFAGWSKADRDQKILAFAKTVRESRPWSFHCSISRIDYARIVAPIAPYPLKNPYFGCFWDVMRLIADYHRSLGVPEVPPVSFIFDNQEGGGHDAALWYDWLKATQLPAIQAQLGPSPVFGDDRQVVPLQAADMLVWHLRRQHERGDAEGPVMDLLLGDQHVYRHVDEATLHQIAIGMKQVPGLAHVQSKGQWRATRGALKEQLAAGLGPPEYRPLRMRLQSLMLTARERFKLWRYPR